MLRLILIISTFVAAALAAPSDFVGLADNATVDANTTLAAQNVTTPAIVTTTLKTSSTKKGAPTKKPKAPKPLECNKAKFQTLDLCCKVPVGTIFPQTTMQNCTKDKKIMSWLNDFNFNLLQNTKLNNSINFTDPLIVKTICAAAPIATCVYNSSKLLGENNTLDNSKMETFLAEGRPSTWKNFSSDMAKLTDEKIKNMIPEGLTSFPCPAKKKGDPAIQTNLVPLIHAQVIQAKALMSCPELADPLPKKENCLTTAETYGKCLGALAASYNDYPGIDF